MMLRKLTAHQTALNVSAELLLRCILFFHTALLTQDFFVLQNFLPFYVREAYFAKVLHMNTLR